MVFDQIEKLKQDYTDKYVVVDGERPELARFRGATGRVKTVNMSGRALVEFEANNNIGWYDIDLDYLKVVDQPLPKPAESKDKPAKTEPAPKPKAAAAPAGEKKLSPLEMARRKAPPSSPARRRRSRPPTSWQPLAGGKRPLRRRRQLRPQPPQRRKKPQPPSRENLPPPTSWQPLAPTRGLLRRPQPRLPNKRRLRPWKKLLRRRPLNRKLKPK